MCPNWTTSIYNIVLNALSSEIAQEKEIALTWSNKWNDSIEQHEYLKESIKMLLELICDFIKFVGYKNQCTNIS